METTKSMIKAEQLVYDNLKLIDFVIHRFFSESDIRYHTLLDYEDLQQLGAVGLWKAANAYDETKGRFSTYAVYAIKNEILAELLQNKKNSCQATDEDMLEKAGSFNPYDDTDAKILLSEIFTIMERKGESHKQEKQNLMLLLYQGYSLKDAAKTFGIDYERAKGYMKAVRKRYGKKEMKQFLCLE